MSDIDEIIAWIHERELNAIRISLTKTGADRLGWLEDAEYFKQAVALMSANKALQARLDVLEKLTSSCNSCWANLHWINEQEKLTKAALKETGQ